MARKQIVLTLIGGPTLLIEVGRFRLLTDPTFDPPGKYASGTITLDKYAGPALAADSLGDIDAVLLSHDQHTDNLDLSGRELLGRAGKVFSTRVAADRLGNGAVGLEPWQDIMLRHEDAEPLWVTGTPARHGPPGFEPITGDVTGFALGLGSPGDLAYVTGDTVWFAGVAEVSRRYEPGLVIPFAGSAKPRGAFRLTMDANDVIETAAAFPNARLPPVHTDGWGHFSESGDELARALETFGLGDRLVHLRPGVPTAVDI